MQRLPTPRAPRYAHVPAGTSSSTPSVDPLADRANDVLGCQSRGLAFTPAGFASGGGPPIPTEGSVSRFVDRRPAGRVASESLEVSGQSLVAELRTRRVDMMISAV